MIGNSQQRILHLLKMRGTQPTRVIARHTKISTVAARKHLSALHDQGLVTFTDESGTVGRPVRHWTLAGAARAQFPDAHDALTLEMISAVRETFGEDGLERMIRTRENHIRQLYANELASTSGLAGRLQTLLRLRNAEGYMAELETTPDGWLLIENHCPICAAARQCQGFCRSELEIFQEILKPLATIERTDHIMTGARRCAYRITPQTPSS